MANEDLNIAKNAINNARGKMINNEFKRDRSNIVSSVAAEVARMFKPFLKEIRETAHVDKTELLSALSQITVEGAPSHVTVPEIKIPEIKVPEPRAHVTVPPIRVPDVIMPDEMNVRGFVSLMGIDLGNPLPVQIRDKDGNPVNLIENITSISGGGSAGGSKIVKISDIRASASSLIDQVEGALKITGNLSATLIAETDTGVVNSDTLRVTQATDSVASVNVYDAFGSTAVDSVFNADNRMRVSVETGGSGLTDAELRAAHLDINQVSGTELSTVVNSGTIDTVTTVTTVTGVTNSIAASLVDSTGVQYSGSNPVPVTGTVTSTPSGTQDVDVTANSIGLATSANQLADGHNVTVDNASGGSAVNIQDGGNSITVDGSVTVSGGLTSTAVEGPIPSDTADVGSNPVKVGGIARTANPTAVGAGDMVSATYDDTGRQVVRPVQVRDLLQTAYVTADSEGPKTLLAGSSGVFHDLVYLMAANESDVAITLDITQTTSGTVQGTLRVPADSTAGLALGGATIPQDHADATWQVDNNASDHSNTTYAVTALFSKEV
jgi:hypothetical protein